MKGRWHEAAPGEDLGGVSIAFGFSRRIFHTLSTRLWPWAADSKGSASCHRPHINHYSLIVLLLLALWATISITTTIMSILIVITCIATLLLLSLV